MGKQAAKIAALSKFTWKRNQARVAIEHEAGVPDWLLNYEERYDEKKRKEDEAKDKKKSSVQSVAQRAVAAGLVEDYLGTKSRVVNQIGQDILKLVQHSKATKSFHNDDPKSLATGFIWNIFANGMALRDSALAKALWNLFEHRGPSMDLSDEIREISHKYGHLFTGPKAQIMAAAVSVALIRKTRQPRLAEMAEAVFQEHLAADLAKFPAGEAPTESKPDDVFEQGVKEQASLAMGVWSQLMNADKAAEFAVDLATDINWHSLPVSAPGGFLTDDDPSVSDVANELGYGAQPVAEFIVALLRLAGNAPMATKVKQYALKAFGNTYTRLPGHQASLTLSWGALLARSSK